MKHIPHRPPAAFFTAQARACVWALLVCGAPASAQAANPPAAGTRDPARTEAEVPRASYRSAFAGYRPWQEQPVGDWRALNDRVGRIGGWRTYLREAHEAEIPPPGSAP